MDGADRRGEASADAARVEVAAAPPRLAADGILPRVLGLAASLRRARVGTTQAATIDALRALPHLDLLDRAQLREGLAAVLLTSPTHRPPFDVLFDLYFPVRPAVDDLAVDASAGAAGAARAAGDEEGATPSTADELLAELLDVLAAGDEDAIRCLARQAVEALGRVDGPDGAPAYFQYRVLRALDVSRLLEALLARARDEDDVAPTPLEQQLRRDELDARLRTLLAEIEADVQRRAAARRGATALAARVALPPVEERDLFRLSAVEQDELRARVRPLARKLAARVAVRRRAGRGDRLDVRRTVRRSLSTGGVPFDPALRVRRPHRPELVLLCDVSGSVASFARFALLLVHELQTQFSRVRSFAFVDTVAEITELFADPDPDTAIRRLLVEAPVVQRDGHSDYGQVLARFRDEHAAAVTPRATLLVLGDARSNYRPAQAPVLVELRHLARRVYWLNPEPSHFWDTGDSVVASYRPHVDAMVEVRNLAQLGRFVERLAT